MFAWTFHALQGWTLTRKGCSCPCIFPSNCWNLRVWTRGWVCPGQRALLWVCSLKKPFRGRSTVRITWAWEEGISAARMHCCCAEAAGAKTNNNYAHTHTHAPHTHTLMHTCTHAHTHARTCMHSHTCPLTQCLEYQRKIRLEVQKEAAALSSKGEASGGNLKGDVQMCQTATSELAVELPPL